MSEPYVIVRRYPYYDVEPDLTKLEFEASNGPFSGIANDYFAPDKIADMGRVLKTFHPRRKMSIALKSKIVICIFCFGLT